MKKIKLFLINGIIITCTSLILRTIGMFFNVYISNKIGSESVGVFELVMSVYFFFITFALSGINLACTRLVSEELAYGEDKDIKLVVKKCLIFSLSFGLISGLTLFIAAPYISSSFLHNKVSSFPFYIISVSLPFVSMSSCINGYFSAIAQIKKTAFVQILEQVIKIAIICYLLNLLPFESVDFAIISLVVGTTISEVCSFFILYILYNINLSKLKQIRSSIKNNFSQKILRISLPIAITSYIRSGLSTIKQLLIPLRLEKSGLSCKDALSEYGMINGMIFPLLLFPNVLIRSFSELLILEFTYYNTRNENTKMNKMLNLIFKYSFIFSFCIIGIFLCFSDSFSLLFYNNINLSNYIKILSPLIIFMYLDSIIDSILKGLDRQITVMGINILDLITCISFIYFLLPIKGLTGYIIVLFISELLNFSLSLKELIKVTKFTINYKHWIISPIFSILFSYLLIKYITNFKTITLLSTLIISILLFILIYVILIYIFNNVIIKKNNLGVTYAKRKF